jgi:hypothetical protein
MAHIDPKHEKTKANFSPQMTTLIKDMITRETENPKDQNLTLGNFQAHADHTLNCMLTP